MELDFKAVQIIKGDSTTPRLVEINLDALKKREVLIKVHYSSINFKDYLALTHQAPILRKDTLIGGIDFCGEVIQSESPDFKTGDRVIGMGHDLSEKFDGGYSEYVWEDAAHLTLLPDKFSSREAMIIGTAGFTAMLAVHMLESPSLQSGRQEKVIAVSGATGGVGMIASIILKTKGYIVDALVRNGSQLSQLTDKPFRNIIEIESLDVSNPLNKETYSGCIDNLGGEVLKWMLSVTAAWGKVISIGLASSAKFDATVYPFILRGINLQGLQLNIPQKLRDKLWHQLADLIDRSSLETILSQEITLSELPEFIKESYPTKGAGRVIVKVIQD
jgi:acrylyl-CoA reductase (NADPH)